MPHPDRCFASALAALPSGTTTGTAGGKRYVATKTLFNAGRSVKLVAEELGGSDYISLNFYMLENSGRLRPCEMSSKKVTDFVLAFVPDHPDAE
ncbi:hypothetical protein [Roseobacter sp. S98]|uniref:hypothetical protein n=1 Tax=Roseobacter algicola (ex Choi et al. 2025) (nom. illeg.) TaxID=3092138 RepID=UPI0035C7330C